MLSSSTARLVEGMAELGEPELVQIKGADEPVPARRLFGVGQQDRSAARAESSLVGRRWEMSAVEGLLDRAIDGHGSVVGVVGPPGIGKSRLTREVAAMANRRGVDVFATFCESHTTKVPFHVIARLMRSATGVEGVDPTAARALIEAGAFSDADPEDVALYEDLLGIADPETAATAHRSGCTPASADRPGEFRDAGHHDPCGLRHRRCALDRRVQRIDARRLPHRDSPDALADADHLPARVSRRPGADAWSTNPGPRPAQRPRDHDAGFGAARARSICWRARPNDRRKSCWHTVLRRGDRSRSSRTRCAARKPRRIRVERQKLPRSACPPRCRRRSLPASIDSTRKRNERSTRRRLSVRDSAADLLTRWTSNRSSPSLLAAQFIDQVTFTATPGVRLPPPADPGRRL